MWLTIKTDEGTTLRSERKRSPLISEWLREEGFPIDTRCAGKGVCRQCEIVLEQGTFVVDGETIALPPGSERAVLSCRTKLVSAEGFIRAPAHAMVRAKVKASETIRKRKHAASIERSEGLALAVDIGTTTVAAALVDRRSGDVLATASDYNAQFHFGDNVISRIVFASESPERLLQARDTVIQQTLNPLIRRLTGDIGVAPEKISRVAVSGNTVMSHLFLGLSPASIGVLPFTPLKRVYPAVAAKELGLSVRSDAEIYVMPSISGYVGGDIVGGILVSGLTERPDGLSALVDIGTNCEIAAFDGQKIVAGASAAGPAFEGAGIRAGCRASLGAIEKIVIDAFGRFRLDTIGGAPPHGVCGSGLIDFLAETFRVGLVNSLGRYDLDALERAGLRTADLRGEQPIHACALTDDQNLWISEKDIEQLLKAKAAVYSGVKCLVGALGRELSDIKTLYLAGSFAEYIQVPNAVAIRALPDLPPERYVKIGNSSLSAAILAATHPDFRRAATALIDRVEVVELNLIPEFEMEYIDALAM